MAMHHKPTRQTAVVGLGATGQSVVRWLRARGVMVTAFDTRRHPPALETFCAEFPDVPVQLGPLTPESLLPFDCVVASPGVPMRERAIAHAVAGGVDVVGDVELFAREARRPVLAITGSNGKSTVTTVAGAILNALGARASVAGNIGRPVLEVLEREDEFDFHVIELSSFQLETTTSLNARAATVLNISPDHMDRYDSLEAYAQAKARVFTGDGVMVLNRDDERVRAMMLEGRATLWFSLAPPQAATDYGVVERDGEAWLCRGDVPLVPTGQLALTGRHNWANLLAALALVEAAGLDVRAAARAATGVRGLAHRSEVVADSGGVLWVNDSKGTNIGATAAALAGMTRPVVLIAGGDGKGASFDELRAVAGGIRHLVQIGRDGPVIAKALEGLVPATRADSLAEAVTLADRLARPGDVVLLSPACASFDMFRNFEDRGDQFRALVRAHIQGGRRDA